MATTSKLSSLAPRLFAAVLPLTMLAMTGCVGSDSLDSDSSGADDEAVGVRKGVDYSWSRPSPHGLHAAGYTFAARYLSHDTTGKNITKGEAHDLIKAGLDIVLVWESGGTNALGGYSQGRDDAHDAAAEADAVGQPTDRPIYFAVDFDAQPSDQGKIDDYFKGVASVIGKNRTGAYGGYYLVKRLFDDKKIKWAWQAYAWSYGHWDKRAQVRQTKNGETVAGASVDLDSAMVADFGQWGHDIPGQNDRTDPGGGDGDGDDDPGGDTPKDIREVAFQANTSSLWTTGNAGTKDWKLGMMPGTSPAIAVEGGDYKLAFQANTGNLWAVDSKTGGGDLHLGMAAGTSPSICALEGGGHQIAFQANTGSLWVTGAKGTGDQHLGMMAGTSPSITCLPDGGWEVAFQANTSSLWTHGTAGTKDWELGLNTASSPSIAALGAKTYVVAFEANTNNLWVVHENGAGGDQHLGMYANTSPSITALAGGGWEVAFQANTTSLWTHGSADTRDWGLGLMPGSSPSIAALAGAAYQVAFEANTKNLWVVSSSGGGGDQHLGMWGGTSPSAD